MTNTYYRRTGTRAAWFERSRKGITVQLRQEGGISHTRQAHSTQQACAMINAWLRDGTILEESQLGDEELHEEAQRWMEGEIASAQAEIHTMIDDHIRRENQIERDGAHLRLKTCPLISLVFGLLAWYSFNSPGGFIPGAWILFTIASLAFLALLVFGVLFDRPHKSP